MAVMWMEVESAWSLPKGDHAVQVDHVTVTLVGEGLPLAQEDASIVESMAIGLETAKLVTGRTSATAVESVAISKETAKTVLKN